MNNYLITSDWHVKPYTLGGVENRFQRIEKALQAYLQYGFEELGNKTGNWCHIDLGDMFDTPKPSIRSLSVFLKNKNFSTIRLQGNHEYTNNSDDSPLKVYEHAFGDQVMIDESVLSPTIMDGIYFFFIPFQRQIEKFYDAFEMLNNSNYLELADKQLVIFCHQYFDFCMPTSKEVVDTGRYRDILLKLQEKTKGKLKDITTISGHYHIHCVDAKRVNDLGMDIWHVGIPLVNSFKDVDTPIGAMILIYNAELAMYVPKRVSFQRKLEELGKFIILDYETDEDDAVFFDPLKVMEHSGNFFMIKVPIHLAKDKEVLRLKKMKNVEISYVQSISDEDMLTSTPMKKEITETEIIHRVVDSLGEEYDKSKLKRIGEQLIA